MTREGDERELHALIAKWRDRSGVRDLTGDYYGEDFDQCADELEEALRAAGQESRTCHDCGTALNDEPIYCKNCFNGEFEAGRISSKDK